MARFVKKLGTVPMRYQFDVTIFQVTVNVPYTVNTIIALKRGNQYFHSMIEQG
jgi:hypothetical protein